MKIAIVLLASALLVIGVAYGRAADRTDRTPVPSFDQACYMGSWQEVARYGGGRNVVFDLQRLRMDFRLPARSGQGEPLTQAALDALLKERQPAVFFSKDLFARYFTYAKNGEAHFILFDDADTLRQKLRLGRQLGVAAAFFQWPEVCDIADSLFRRK